ncbi:hypothetical protein AAHA92_21181 [Salvia divinorum]|uniref:Uncharacterized protein n=1 Tax=Salvia divinorum TaxID=28513 RepID=A0ABD1GJM4_SALDI
MSKCPAASTFPPNLSHLTLSETRLRDDPMAELGKLPKLLFLKMQYDCYRGETMQVSCNGFPSLEVLALRYLSLRCVYVEEGGMSQLKHVRVRRCPHLQTRNMRENISISVQ